jgi:hypothetical protein
MQALRTRHHHPLFQPGDLGEKSTREPRRPRRESHGVSVLESPEANDRLDSWKEIASHLQRTVRTVQRWERREGLPVHRHLHQRANSVYARKSELDEWWNHEPHSREIERPQIPSEGSRRQVTSPPVFTVLHSEEECQESHPTPSEWLVEWAQELREAAVCSPEDGTVHVVCVLRVRIRNGEYLLQPDLEATTRNAKARVVLCACLARKWSVAFTRNTVDGPRTCQGIRTSGAKGLLVER